VWAPTAACTSPKCSEPARRWTLPPLPLRAGADRPIEGYHRLHAGIYDATRWSFSFGREAVLERVAEVAPAPKRILEVGCGTGRNLVSLARRFPRAQITGVDLSDSMLAVARRKTAAYGARVSLRQRAYDAPA